jgi:hypothetical protein
MAGRPFGGYNMKAHNQSLGAARTARALAADAMVLAAVRTFPGDIPTTLSHVDRDALRAHYYAQGGSHVVGRIGNSRWNRIARVVRLERAQKGGGK